MQQTKLIQLLRCFSPKELKQFDSFIESPYYNRSERLIKLFRLLSAYQPAFDSEKLDKEKVFAKMYGKVKYNDLTMRELTSSLFQLAKEFIAVEQLRNDELGMSQQRYEWLVQHGSTKQREQEIEFGEKLLSRIKVNDDSYYLHKWYYDFYRFEHTTETFRDVEHKWLHERGFGDHIHSLNKLYLYRMFESHNYILNWSDIYNQPFDNSIFEHSEELALKYIKDDPVLSVYYNLVQLTKTDEERFYFELKSIFFENAASIPLDLKINVSIGLENYGTKKMREGDSRFVAELMEVYRFTIKNEYATGKKRGMPYLFYINVVITAFEAGEIDWAEEFINEYKSKLEVDRQQDVYQYCYAYLLFEKKQFDEALKLALSVNTSIYFNKIELKGLVTRIHFELGMFDQVEVMLDTYKYYLAEDKLSQTRKEHYANFVSVIKKLVLLKQNFSATEVEKISLQVTQTKSIAYRRWLIAKIKEIKKVK